MWDSVSIHPLMDVIKGYFKSNEQSPLISLYHSHLNCYCSLVIRDVDEKHQVPYRCFFFFSFHGCFNFIQYNVHYLGYFIMTLGELNFILAIE